jgi:hypothetical protein
LDVLHAPCGITLGVSLTSETLQYVVLHRRYPEKPASQKWPFSRELVWSS